MPPQPPLSDAPSLKRRIGAWTWTTLIAVPVILAASFGSYFILADPIPDSPSAAVESGSQENADRNMDAELEIARLRAEARRNALATGAGFVAIAALILALRRQQHLERSTANSEADALRRQEHLERVAAANEDDALQRRITDARIRAVEQLGSDNPAVRIGGLHNLERIGQQHAELRQVVLDEICSYLRLPFAPTKSQRKVPLPKGQFEPVGPPSADVESNESEREVRLIAQEVLQRHLDIESPDRYWEHSRLNLRNAHLDSLDLSGCRLNCADFSNAVFDVLTQFENAVFTGKTQFVNATFTDTTQFMGSTFTGDTQFKNATFVGQVRFGRATFTREVQFDDVIFTERAWFSRVAFTRETWFSGTVFSKGAWFNDATFADGVDFSSSSFTAAAFFDRAAFSEVVFFHKAVFSGVAQFTDVSFMADAVFDYANFTGDTVFDNATFTQKVWLRCTTFDRNARIGVAAKFHGSLHLTSTVLIELLQSQAVYLAIEAAHQLPDGWRLDPTAANPGFGLLIHTDQIG